MNLLAAYKQLQPLAPTFLTREAASILGVSNNYAVKILSRLSEQRYIVHIARGRWAYSPTIDPLLLPNILVQPMLAYISLYSALYYRGMIDQIPSTVFAISNGKTKIFNTPLGKVSIHNISGTLFTGYEVYGNQGLLMATPEKALFDTLYLMPARSNVFKRLTEIDLSEDFDYTLFDIALP